MQKAKFLEERRQRAEAWLTQQRLLGHAPAVTNQLRGDVIHDVTIEGQRFSAWISCNSIMVGARNAGGCALGVASINDESLDGPGWAICKYWNQRHVDLTLTASGRRTLALEFGLPIIPSIGYLQMDDFCERDFFYLAPVFQSLIAWAAAHPRKIRTLFGDSYLGLWPMSAMEGRRVDVNDENVDFARSGYRGARPHQAMGGVRSQTT
jgi:hypothetical protein